MASPCCSSHPSVIVIGGGSAAFAAGIKASSLGATVTMINAGLPIGGCCVNVGCVPSKTLLRAAETLHRPKTTSSFHGIKTSGSLEDFQAVIDQKRDLVMELRRAKYIDVAERTPNLSLLVGHGTIVSAGEDGVLVDVDGESLQADRAIIATGSSPWVPDVPGLDTVSYLTSTDAFELDELPPSLIVVGGRYIALECAQMFQRLGSSVTVLQRSSTILPTEHLSVSESLRDCLVGEGVVIQTDVTLTSV